MQKGDLNMNEAAKEARREYQRQYREANRERINANHKAWRDANPDKVKAAATRYWEKKGAELRAN